MSKPTIFFSHSSLDKAQLTRLKDIFCSKMGGSIDVFLSSDGQSIPLGRNWVYRVQEGLEAAALMIVFITPQSIGSSWVYFEAGYSYAKGIRVIPVGFLGVDLGQLRPPLSLLQGFNITSADTLNNLIALTNDQFKHTHTLNFTPEEYNNILGKDADQDNGPFREILEYIEDLRLYLTKDDGLKEEAEQLLPAINKLLDDASIEHQSGKSFIRLWGVTISVGEDSPPKRLKIDADPTTLHTTLPIILKIIDSIRHAGVQDVGFTFVLTSGVEVLQKAHKITARLYDSEIQLRPEGGFVFRELKFEIGYYHGFSRSSSPHGNAYVEMTPITKAFNMEDAATLLTLLLTNKVIFQERSPISFLD